MSSSQRKIPDLSWRVAVVTGANSGLGFETARVLARRRAHVVLAVRSEERGREAADRIRERHPGASVEVRRLDLADLASVRAFADGLRAAHPVLHLLVNNAGIMAVPPALTADGFESQLGVCHLGHFALTGLLLPTLLQADHGRVVTVTSLYHRFGRLDLDTLDLSDGYGAWPAYGRAKLANMVFAVELQRRLDEAGADLVSVAAHPGYSSTNLQYRGPQLRGSAVGESFFRLANRVAGTSARVGAAPILLAATEPDLRGGELLGPGGWLQVRGEPAVVPASRQAHDPEAGQRLWRVSEEATGVEYPL